MPVSMHAGAPPTSPPLDVTAGDIDEGPSRRELRRQIARLEHRFAYAAGPYAVRAPRPVQPTDGPRTLTAPELEAVRDALLAALGALTASS